MYQGLSRQALDQSLPQILQQLSARGMMDSSVGSDALSNAAMQIIPQFANMGYQSQMDAANMRMQIPSILATLGQLGQYSQSAGTSSSQSSQRQEGITSGYSNTDMSNTNPLAPYELMANFLMNY
jgi:hypothetical protein